MMTRRALGSAIVLVSIIVLPYWFYIPALFVAIILFPFFWEGILFVFLINVLYGNGMEILPLLVSPFAILVLVVLIILLPLRERLRLHV